MARKLLTGGSGDVNPQYMTANTRAVAINEYSVDAFNLPVARIGGSKTKAIVMEILRVDWYINIQDLIDSAQMAWAFLATVTSRTDGETSNFLTAQNDPADPLVFAFAIRHKGFVVNGGHNEVMPISIDLTDGAGHGILVATDRLFIVGGSANGTSVGDSTAKILYRLKEVGITEYVGIVQSQQG